MKLLAILGVLLYSTLISSEETRLLDLPPNEAQNIIDKQDLSLNYAPKIDSNVPALRYLGDELHEVLEDIYNARQFHGQDGLGGYVYGYSVPDIAKAEKKTAGGDLKGSYSYVNGQGQEIKVEYWDDGTGFHQTDNIPKVVLEAQTDTPEVKAAREEHFRIWNEIAARNAAAASGAPDQQNPDEDSAKNAYDESKDESGKYVPTKEELEPPKDPKGFFYDFTYPVGIIVDKGKKVSNAGKQKRDVKDPFDVQNELYNKNIAILTGDLKVGFPEEDSRLSLRAVNFGAQLIAAVHDVQVPSYLRDKVPNSQTNPLYFHKE